MTQLIQKCLKKPTHTIFIIKVIFNIDLNQLKDILIY